MIPAMVAPQRAVLRCAAVSKSTFGTGRVAARTPSRVFKVSNGTRVSAWFKFGKAGFDSKDAGIVGSQGRDEYDAVSR